MFQLFQDVFAGEMSARIVRVCAFSVDLATFSSGYGMIAEDNADNPHNQKADLFAVAPYVGANLNGNDTNIVTLFHNAIDATLTSYVIPAHNIAETYGVPLGTYEGGQHLLTGANKLSSNPLIYNEYTYMLERFSPYFVLFANALKTNNSSKLTGAQLNYLEKYKTWTLKKNTLGWRTYAIYSPNGSLMTQKDILSNKLTVLDKGWGPDTPSWIGKGYDLVDSKTRYFKKNIRGDLTVEDGFNQWISYFNENGGKPATEEMNQWWDSEGKAGF